jgi:hypothetical protein
MKYFLFSLSIILGFVSSAQEDTTIYRHEKSMMIIPIEQKMYRSEIDKDLGTANGKTHDQLFRDIRYGTALQFTYEMLYRYKAFTLINMIEDSVRRDLNVIYNGIGYKYTVVADTVGFASANKLEKFKRNINNTQDQLQKPKNGMHNGEIVSERDTRKKHMKTVIKNDSLLPYLNVKYQCDYYLFINEIDLINDLSNQEKLATGDWDRALKIHFTVFDSNGKEIETGILEKNFPKDENDLQKIIKVHIKDLAGRLRKSMGIHERNQEIIGGEEDSNTKPLKKKVVSLRKLKGN